GGVLHGRVAVVLLHVEGAGIGGADLAGDVGLEERLQPVGGGGGVGEGVEHLVALGIAAVVGAVGVEEVVGVDVLALAVDGGAPVARGCAHPVGQVAVGLVRRRTGRRPTGNGQRTGVHAGVEQG